MPCGSPAITNSHNSLLIFMQFLAQEQLKTESLCAFYMVFGPETEKKKKTFFLCCLSDFLAKDC